MAKGRLQTSGECRAVAFFLHGRYRSVVPDSYGIRFKPCMNSRSITVHARIPLAISREMVFYGIIVHEFHTILHSYRVSCKKPCMDFYYALIHTCFMCRGTLRSDPAGPLLAWALLAAASSNGRTQSSGDCRARGIRTQRHLRPVEFAASTGVPGA